MTLESTVRSLAEVKAFLDDLLRIAGLDESGNGLIVGGRPMVAKVGLAVNCSFQVIEAAAARGCDLLVTHHASWPEIDLHLSQEKYGRMAELGINFYAAHECLDASRELGTSDALARGVRVAVQGAFKPDGKSEAGVHGVTTGTFSEFASRVGQSLGIEPKSWRNSDSFGHVGVIAGAGGRTGWMAAVQALGCDTFLTGEASLFGLLFARETGLNLVIAGHYATEVPGILALSARIARDLKLDVTFIPEEILER